MKMRLSLLFILACNAVYLYAQETRRTERAKQKISLGARNTWNHFLGPVQIDSALQIPNRPITDTADAQKNKKLKYRGVLFYGTNADKNRLYYYNGKRFVALATGEKDSSIYSTDGIINDNRTVTLNGTNKLSFKNSDYNLLVLNNQNVGIGTNDPQKNLHLKGSFRYENTEAKQWKVLTASNEQGDAQWHESQNIYTVNGTIKTGTGGTTVTIPQSARLKFAGGITSFSGIQAAYKPNKQRKFFTTSTIENPSYAISLGTDPPAFPSDSYNSTIINAYGNLLITSKTDYEEENNALSLIPLVINYTANAPNLTLFYKDDPNEMRYVARNGSGQWSSPDSYTYKNLKALICGNMVIEGGMLLVTSDKRIKKIWGTALEMESVRRIKNINLYHYQFKDTLAKGNKIITGVIAQELQKVMPDAVFTLPEAVVPNIYKHTDSIRNIGNNTRLYLPIRLNPDSSKIGTKLKFYLKNNKTENRKILKVTKNYIEVPYLCEENERVFVYGSFVNDLLNIDYNQIFMENVNATKYLLQQQEVLKQELKEQKVLLQKLLK